MRKRVKNRHVKSPRMTPWINEANAPNERNDVGSIHRLFQMTISPRLRFHTRTLAVRCLEASLMPPWCAAKTPCPIKASLFIRPPFQTATSLQWKPEFENPSCLLCYLEAVGNVLRMSRKGPLPSRNSVVFILKWLETANDKTKVNPLKSIWWNNTAPLFACHLLLCALSADLLFLICSA